MLEKIEPYKKAVLGFLAPGAVVIMSSVLDGSAGGTGITAGEWITAACSMIITGAGVYAVANRPASPVEPPRG